MAAQDTIISFYKFVPVEDPQLLKNKWKELCAGLGTRGTILIAREGINGMVSGPEAKIKALTSAIHSDSRFSDVEFKKSSHDQVSFRRMLVKVKKYIITMREEVDPLQGTGAYLDPLEFKKWQDEKKDLVILDTRNDYEVALGTFKNAINPGIKSFDEFPAWVRDNLQDAKEKPVVTFCTGGIRCEKATAYMQQQGFKKVYQLHGGIIRYLEKTLLEEGDNHWEGDCVVFDKRKAVNKALEPSEKVICYVCLSELNAKNTCPEEYPGGQICNTCAEKMDHHQQKRTARGLSRHQENLKKRAGFLASERKKFEKAGLNSAGKKS